MTNAAPRPGARSRRLVRMVGVVLLALHGVTHFAGTVVALVLIRDGGTARLVGGGWPTGSAAVLTLLAALWLLAGVGFLASGALIWWRVRGARTVLLTAACLSLLLSAVGLWTSLGGVLIDLAVLAVMTARPEFALPVDRSSRVRPRR